MHSWSASATASPPRSRISASVPRNSTKATPIERCSGSRSVASRWLRIATGRHSAIGRPPMSSIARRSSERRRREPSQQEARPLRRADVPGRQPRGRCRRDDDLAGVGLGFEQRRLGRCATGDQELAVALTDEEEVEHAGVHSDRHPQNDRARLSADPADTADRALHLGGAAAGPYLVVVAVVEQQHRVAAPLDHAGAVVVRDRQQLGERRVERVAQLLGADLPLSWRAARRAS